MKHKKTVKLIVSLALVISMSITGCSSEEPSPIVGNDDAATDEITNPVQEQDSTAENSAETTAAASNETKPAEASIASTTTTTTSNGSNQPANTSTQTTTKPAATTTQNGTKPATTTAATATTTTKPSAAPVTTTAQTTKPAGSTTTTTAPAPAVTTKPAPAVTTTPKPFVTTTPTPAVTTTPAPSHTHSYSAKITKEPTCTAAGVKTFTCSCGDKYTETIPANGHNWHTETIHHDAEYGTRNVTETWAHGYYIMALSLTPKGVEAGLGGNNLTDPLLIRLGMDKYTTECYYVLLTEFWCKPGDPSSVEWVYTYDNIDPKELEEAAKLIGRDDIKYDIGVLEGAVVHDCGDWLKNGLWWGNWGTTDVYEYEDRIVGTETYVIKDAYDETITTCATCGIRK